MSKNKHIWAQHGVPSEMANRCDAAMSHILKAMEEVGPGLCGIVLKEARFQVEELPERTESFRKRMCWKPPK